MAMTDPAQHRIELRMHAYLVPAVSLVLSLPALLCLLALCAVAGYHALTGHALDLSAAQPLLQRPVVPGLLLLYVVFGPMLGVVLCVLQRVRMLGASGGSRVRRVRPSAADGLALGTAGLALGVLMLLVVVSMILRAGT